MFDKLRNKNWAKVLAVLLVAVFLLISGCSAGVAKSQDIVVGSTASTSFKMPYTYYGYSGYLKGTVFESLITLGPDWTFQPLLAESWEQESGTSYVFHLRSGVKFSDGTPLKAEDVRTSVNYMINTLKSSYLGSVKEVEVIDDSTVRILLKEPTLNFLHEMSSYGNVVRILETDEKGWITEAVGTGPFILSDFGEGESITLMRNPNYWQGKVELETVTIKVIDEPATVSAALEAGQIDIADTFATEVIPFSDIPRFEASKDFALYKDYIRIVFLGLNPTRAPFDDINVRKAVCYALDKDVFNTILSGGGAIIWGPVSPVAGIWCNDSIEPYPTDLAQADALLTRSGWGDSDGDGVREKDGEELSVLLLLPPRSAERTAIAESVQYQLSAIGIEVKIQELEWAAISERMKAGDWDIVGPANDSYSGRIPPRWDFMVYPLCPGYLLDNDQTFHEMVDNYSSLITEDKQVGAAHEIQQYLADTYAFPFWYEFYRITVTNAKIANFTPSPGENHSLRFLWQAYVAE